MQSHMSIMRNTALEDMVSTEQVTCSYLVRLLSCLARKMLRLSYATSEMEQVFLHPSVVNV